MVIQIVIGVLGTTPVMLPKILKEMGSIKTNLREMQKAVILNTAKNFSIY